MIILSIVFFVGVNSRKVEKIMHINLVIKIDNVLCAKVKGDIILQLQAAIDVVLVLQVNILKLQMFV